MKILVSSCVRKMERIRMRRSRKHCAARPLEGGKHAVSKFRRAVSMKNSGRKEIKMQHSVGDKKSRQSDNL